MELSPILPPRSSWRWAARFILLLILVATIAIGSDWLPTFQDVNSNGEGSDATEGQREHIWTASQPASFVIKARFEGRSRTAASLKRSPPISARSEFVTADAAGRARVFPLDRAER